MCVGQLYTLDLLPPTTITLCQPIFDPFCVSAASSSGPLRLMFQVKTGLKTSSDDKKQSEKPTDKTRIGKRARESQRGHSNRIPRQQPDQGQKNRGGIVFTKKRPRKNKRLAWVRKAIGGIRVMKKK